MLLAIRQQLRQARRKAAVLLALVMLLGAFAAAHSLCTAAPMDMGSHHGGSDAAMICLFLVEAGALALGVALAARVLRGGWQVRRSLTLIPLVRTTVLAATPATPARAGPLLQVFRL